MGGTCLDGFGKNYGRGKWRTWCTLGMHNVAPQSNTMNSPESLLAQAYDGLRKDLQLAEANADQAWSEMLAQSERTGEPIALRHRAKYLTCLAHVRRCEEVIAAAIPAIEAAREEGDVIVEAELQHALGMSYWFLQKAGPALEAIRRGIQCLSAQKDSDSMLGGFHELSGVISRNQGKLEKALDYIQQAKLIWVEKGDARRLLVNRVNYATTLLHKGDFTGALEGSLEARSLLGEVGDVGTRCRLAFTLAIIHQSLEDVAPALAEARDAIAYSHECGDLNTRVGAQCILAEILCDMGDLEGALENALLAKAELDKCALPFSRVNYLTSIGELFRRLDMPEKARSCFLSVQTNLGSDENPRVLFDLRCHLLELNAVTGQLAEQTAEVEQLYELSRELGSVDRQINLLRIGSDAWEKAGDLTKALDWQRRRMEQFTMHHSLQSDDKIRSLQIKHKLDKALEVQHTLEASRAALEQHVEQRTLELTEANRMLEKEIQERHVAEDEAIKLQTSLRQAERLESLGRLAGGVAHDFNNLLTVVMGSARLLSEENHGIPGITTYADEILKAGRSGSRLTERLLAFSKRWDMRISEVRVRDLLSNVLFLTERLIGDDVDLVVELADTNDLVSIDTSQLDSVFMNLALNARDSMPMGGILRVTSEVIDGFDLVNPLHREFTGRVLRILVEDQGHGIEDKDRGFIFDPFFTTKSPEKGTGLGLSSSLGVIQHLGGRLSLVRTSSEGTLFEVLLPMIEAEQGVVAPSLEDLTPSRPNGVRADALQGLRILLVEDDVAVRRLLSTQLKFMKLVVSEANDGKHALELFEEAAPDLILSDINMPRMSGPELLSELRSRGITTPMLLASGWPEHHADQMPRNAGIVTFLQKPFELGTLRFELLKLLSGDVTLVVASESEATESPES